MAILVTGAAGFIGMHCSLRLLARGEAVIGIAEGCIIPAVGALVNAVFNATGVRVRETPATPDKILMGLMNPNILSRG